MVLRALVPGLCREVHASVAAAQMCKWVIYEYNRRWWYMEVGTSPNFLCTNGL